MDDGGFVNAGFNNDHSNLDYYTQRRREQHAYQSSYQCGPDSRDQESKNHHYVKVHSEYGYHTNPNTDISYNIQDRGQLPIATSPNGQQENLVRHVGYNTLGKLATDV